MIQSGEAIAAWIATHENRIQPAGIDLTLDTIERVPHRAELSDNISQLVSHPQLGEEMHPVGGSYTLPPGAYIVRYEETIEIPPDCIGLVLPRSRLLRAGCHVGTAVWDPGYQGRGMGLLEVHATDYVELKRGMGVAQMIHLQGDDIEDEYDGTYQGEGLEEDESQDA